VQPASVVASWPLVAQSRGRSLRLVRHPPGFNGGARCREGAKPVRMHAPLPKPGAAGLDTRMIRRRPWPAASPLYAMALRPGLPRLGRALRTSLDTSRLRQPRCRGPPLTHGPHPLAPQGDIDRGGRTLTTPGLHARERATPSPVGQALAAAGETPGLLWRLRPGPGHAPLPGTRSPALQSGASALPAGPAGRPVWASPASLPAGATPGAGDRHHGPGRLPHPAAAGRSDPEPYGGRARDVPDSPGTLVSHGPASRPAHTAPAPGAERA
jgi:hypothetical protein